MFEKEVSKRIIRLEDIDDRRRKIIKPERIKKALQDETAPESWVVFEENGKEDMELLTYLQGEEVLVGNEKVKIAGSSKF